MKILWRISLTNPNYPMAIVSKGRSEYMTTSRSLNRMKIPHYIIIEPQDEEPYKEALKEFGITHATLLVAPFSNHGDGPGRARNWWWDYSKEVLDADAHWIMDDNIADFYRLHQNMRIRVESGALFRSCEDFVDRYENILMSGLQYRFFISPNQKYPPYVTNTRIYSCNLIRNDCPFRWRGRYNEDTILSLDILKAGYCTVQFNHFLQSKIVTQAQKGGNTQEFYHTENMDEEKAKKGWNEDGTINKSKMLVDAHPDVSRLVWKYNRWHHYVDYSPFKKTKLKLKEGVKIPQGVNNYGLHLIDNYTGP